MHGYIFAKKNKNEQTHISDEPGFNEGNLLVAEFIHRRTDTEGQLQTYLPASPTANRKTSSNIYKYYQLVSITLYK